MPGSGFFIDPVGGHDSYRETPTAVPVPTHVAARMGIPLVQIFVSNNKKIVMEQNNKRLDEQRSDTANIRQTNAQQNEQGEINMGGSEFSGDGTDTETSSTGLPTMSPEKSAENHPAQDPNSERKS